MVGDRYFNLSSLAVCYIWHSNNRTFELRIEPVQQEKTDLTQQFFNQMLNNDETKQCIRLSITHDDKELETAELYVDAKRRWVVGEGLWQQLEGNPKHLELEYKIHLTHTLDGVTIIKKAVWCISQC